MPLQSVPAYKLGDPGGGGRPGVTQGPEPCTRHGRKGMEGEGALAGQAGWKQHTVGRPVCCMTLYVLRKPQASLLCPHRQSLARTPATSVSQTDTSLCAFLCTAITKWRAEAHPLVTSVHSRAVCKEVRPPLGRARVPLMTRWHAGPSPSHQETGAAAGG